MERGDSLGLHNLFEQQARRSPEAVAVVDQNSSTTFRDLDRRADLLASRLSDRGIGPGSTVGLGFDHCTEFVVSLLAVLKSGAAFLPLDPSYPSARLAFMVVDSSASLILTHSRFAGAWSATKSVFCLDTDASSTDLSYRNTPAPPVSGDDPAYLIYTSGSTGTPNGVQVSHHAIAQHILSVIRCFGLGPSDRILGFASLSFDAALEQLLGGLVSGATLVFRAPVLPSALELSRFIAKQRITVADLPPSIWVALTETWAKTSAVSDATTLRLVIVGGEEMPSSGLKLWREAPLGHIRLFNAYGPTEAVITATRYEVTDLLVLSETVPRIPIGCALGNRRCYLLDPQGQLVPAGSQGELYIGGDLLATGYLNRPELTAQRFIRDPFQSAPNARLYRTGDLCRWRSDGELEFLGRLDEQVKIRGFRIELGEIETAVRSHPSIAQAVAVIHGLSSDDKKVIVGVVLREEAKVQLDSLYQHLASRLLPHMMPSGYVVLEQIPTLPNGKVDRRAIASSPYKNLARDVPYEPPQGSVEEGLASIWKSLLDREQIGRTDNFFALGGHSLLAMRMISQIQQRLGVELALQKIFECSNLTALGGFLSELLDRNATATGLELPQPRNLAVELRSIPPVISQDQPSVPAGLSCGQEQLWFLEQLHPGTSTYHVVDNWCLRGPVDHDALRAALEEVVARHDSMRMVFEVENQRVTQRPADIGSFRLEVKNVSGANSQERRENAHALACKEAALPFRFAGDPLFRAQLLRVDAEEHWLLMTAHHAVTDGWSVALVLAEISESYLARTTGRPARLNPSPLQYGDFVVWQRTLLETTLSSHLPFWRNYLENFPEATALPYDYPRPVSGTHRGGRAEALLPPHILPQLGSLSRTEATTSFMTALAASQAFLMRYTGQSDMVIGTAVTGREHSQLHDSVGFFVNMVVLRTRLDASMTFREVLRKTKTSALDAFAHQEYPFEKLVRELCPTRDGTTHPIFQVVVLYENRKESRLTLPNVDCSPIAVPSHTSKFDLTLLFREDSDGLTLELEFNRDLFRHSTVDRMLGHLRNLIVQALANPDRCVGDLALFAEAERAEWLEVWNKTQSSYPRTACIHSVLETEADRRPDAVAVVLESRELTYRQLDQQANALAHRLQSLGVATGTRVAVCMERSVELIVSLLAILKAGGAYVPLAAEYPAHLLQFMMDDAGAAVLLTQQALWERFSSSQINAVVIVDVLDKLERFPITPPPCSVSAESLAYVIYTSGSTGRPKGVMIPHRGVVRLVKSTNYASFSDAEVFLQFAPTSFDASTLEIWGPLLNGGRLILLPPDAGSVEEIAEALRRFIVTTLWLSSGLFNVMVDERLEDLKGLRQLIAGGDVLSVSHVKRAFAGLPGCRIINGYGPTENTTFTCCHTVRESDLDAAAMPIGRPIANTHVYILDDRGQPVPPGVAGELYAGGDGLALGYLNRPELTQEKFIPDPIDPGSGGRLYKTGDVCRYREDGIIEFLGRKDQQVKIRGFRIELSEIELCLNRHPALREAVVIATGEGSDGKKLVAYFVASTREAVAVESLRDYIRTHLPSYMMPGAFVALSSLPLNPNGKIDRKALSKLAVSSAATVSDYSAPRTLPEARMAQLWAEVLGRARVGIHDDFFALGGHSLIALRLFARVEEVFSQRLPLAALFQSPTVAKLVALIESTEESQTLWSSLVTIRAEGNRTPFFCVHGGGGEVIFARDLTRHLSAEIPFYGLQARGLQNPAERDESIEQMAAHYLEQIRRVVRRGPISLGGYCMGGLVAYEMAQRLRQEGWVVENLFLIDTHNPSEVARWRQQTGNRSLWPQKLAFQIGNLRRLEMRACSRYLWARSHAAIVRRWRWMWNTLSSWVTPGHSPGGSRSVDSVRTEAHSLRLVNQYSPKPTNQDVILLRPDLNYDGLADLNMGWSELVHGELEVVMLPVSPGGMLVEPFIGLLGSELNRRLLAPHP